MLQRRQQVDVLTLNGYSGPLRPAHERRLVTRVKKLKRRGVPLIVIGSECHQLHEDFRAAGARVWAGKGEGRSSDKGARECIVAAWGIDQSHVEGWTHHQLTNAVPDNMRFAHDRWAIAVRLTLRGVPTTIVSLHANATITARLGGFKPTRPAVEWRKGLATVDVIVATAQESNRAVILGGDLNMPDRPLHDDHPRAWYRKRGMTSWANGVMWCGWSPEWTRVRAVTIGPLELGLPPTEHQALLTRLEVAT